MNTRAGWIPLFGLLLAGCASGGGGGMTVTAAAPPPTAEVYPNLDTINGVTLAAATGAALVNFNRQNTPTGTASATAATVNFAYSDPLKVYSVSANGVEQTFGNADLQASPSGYYFRTSTGAGGATLTNSLQISRDTFSYTGWGAWLNGSSNGGIENFDRFYFTYGIVTHAGDMPRSGTAS
jgi:hypothetical protein